MSPLPSLSFATLSLQTKIAPVLGAATQADVLGRSLVLAAVIVAPYGIYKVRQVRRVRANHKAVIAAEEAALLRDGSGDSTPPRPALEDVIRDIAFVVDEATRAGGAMLLVPHDVTVSDRDAPRSVVDTLIRDALRRSGLVVTAEIDSPEGRMLECSLAKSTFG
ncbi:MAG: hypothetical protein WBF71_01160 [Microthrixaceae bacterium]